VDAAAFSSIKVGIVDDVDRKFADALPIVIGDAVACHGPCQSLFDSF
jgi:hypothetical protein